MQLLFETFRVYIKKYLQLGIEQGYIRENLNVDVAAFWWKKAPTPTFAHRISKNRLFLFRNSFSR